MATQVEAKTGLARAFAEYWLLPDLLQLNTYGGGTVESWAALLDREGFTMDHVDDAHLPEGDERHLVMAQDAWRIAEWLELTRDGGLTEAGREVAEVAGYFPNERTQAVWEPAEYVLTEQIRAYYRGPNDIAIADLVQEGARTLARAQDEWIQVCPGLLLVEFESLIYLAFADPDRAVQMPGELVRHRREAMREWLPPAPDSDELTRMLFHADMVAEYYLEALPGYIDEDEFTLTAVQATLILFVFCGLLKCRKLHLPVQYLVAPNE